MAVRSNEQRSLALKYHTNSHKSVPDDDKEKVLMMYPKRVLGQVESCMWVALRSGFRAVEQPFLPKPCAFVLPGMGNVFNVFFFHELSRA